MIALGLAVVGGSALVWWLQTPVTKKPQPASASVADQTVKARAGERAAGADPVKTVSTPTEKANPAPSGPTTEELAGRVKQIERDYDEVRAKASAEYSAAPAKFPGGLNAFLRQLALLEREKRQDIRAVLGERGAEDYELERSSAGVAVKKWLDDTAATDEQRRVAFRLQREFEDTFALTFDLTPKALLERETARQQTQERIRAALGDTLFTGWMRGEGEDFGKFAAFAAEQKLAPGAVVNLWQAKNEFVLGRLEINTRTELTPPQKRAAIEALVTKTETRLLGVVGPAALPEARKNIMGWLPR